MENTKQIKEFYESLILEAIEKAVDQIKKDGFTSSTYTTLSLLAQDLDKLNAAKHFFNAHHPEGLLGKKIGA